MSIIYMQMSLDHEVPCGVFCTFYNLANSAKCIWQGQKAFYSSPSFSSSSLKSRWLAFFMKFPGDYRGTQTTSITQSFKAIVGDLICLLWHHGWSRLSQGDLHFFAKVMPCSGALINAIINAPDQWINQVHWMEK